MKKIILGGSDNLIFPCTCLFNSPKDARRPLCIFLVQILQFKFSVLQWEHLSKACLGCAKKQQLETSGRISCEQIKKWQLLPVTKLDCNSKKEKIAFAGCLRKYICFLKKSINKKNCLFCMYFKCVYRCYLFYEH